MCVGGWRYRWVAGRRRKSGVMEAAGLDCCHLTTAHFPDSGWTRRCSHFGPDSGHHSALKERDYDAVLEGLQHDDIVNDLQGAAESFYDSCWPLWAAQRLIWNKVMIAIWWIYSNSWAGNTSVCSQNPLNEYLQRFTVILQLVVVLKSRWHYTVVWNLVCWAYKQEITDWLWIIYTFG